MSEAYGLDTSRIGQLYRSTGWALKYSKMPRLNQCKVRAYIGWFLERNHREQGGKEEGSFRMVQEATGS